MQEQIFLTHSFHGRNRLVLLLDDVHYNLSFKWYLHFANARGKICKLSIWCFATHTGIANNFLQCQLSKNENVWPVYFYIYACSLEQFTRFIMKIILSRQIEKIHGKCFTLDNSMFSEIYFNYNILIEFRLHI